MRWDMQHTMKGRAIFTMFWWEKRYEKDHLEDLDVYKRIILWRIDPLLRGDSVNNSRCYGVPADYACMVILQQQKR
jgi:hypothetical protein